MRAPRQQQSCDVLSSTKLREGTPRRTVGLAMCALCVGLFAWAVPLMISDRQLRGEPPCDLQCKSKLPILPSLAESYLTLVEHAVRGVLYEVPPVGQIASLKVHRGTDDTHTMLPVEGLQNFRSAIEKVIVDGIPGDVAELGVWRGGASLFAKAVLDAYGQSMRRIHLFDVFDSLDLHGYGERCRVWEIRHELCSCHKFQLRKIWTAGREGRFLRRPFQSNYSQVP